MRDDQSTALLETLQRLMQQSDNAGWVSTRQLSDALDKSVYSVRPRMIALRKLGRVTSKSQGKGRHNALLWKVVG